MSSSLNSFANDAIELFNSGDPIVKEFFWVKSNFWPFFMCGMYLLAVKFGPIIMENRKPFRLRNTMIAYNIIIVVIYTSVVITFFYCVSHIGNKAICHLDAVVYGDYSYILVRCAWMVYLLKYVEFLDTIFFILRKKNNLITKLHVIHHCIIVIFSWIFLRTERSGFQAYPATLNCIIHIVMYTYYALAAMGLQKYLWWKKYLTMAQMGQFISILLLSIIWPFIGCRAAKTSLFIHYGGTVFFFAMFLNFYFKTFKPSKLRKSESVKNSEATNEVEKISNGVHECYAKNGKEKLK